MNLSTENQISYCFTEQKPCLGWAQTYFKDCLCNQKDYFSFGFGLVSLFCWAVAEIPQIVTNFGTKSSHGVSIVFLLTWVVGDVFNLVGCILEPATLPTQLYTAMLYTVTTIVLVLQSFYYDYFYKCLRKTKKHHSQEEVEDVVKQPLIILKTDESGVPIPNRRGNSIKGSPRTEFYYMSARSLAGSATPPARSNLWPVRSGPSAVRINDSSSGSDDEGETNRPSTISSNSSSQPTPIPRSAAYGTFLATALNMPHQSNALMQASIGLAGRKLLQDSGSSETYIIGQCLGWMMAAIYMGGRIPQIWLNIKRGSVEGLNPLMFIFALIANLAYVGSILVRTTEWDKIRANLPWLLDAAACVVLDAFIISQYIYYRYYQRRASEGRDDYGDYGEANKK
ncbi:hypothetical protein LIER_21079 [Lithospermum erythrorhizon]|uniref:Vacuolar amino acid transporter YPQ1 n=1 Tax=Lithospermum erythrorhizon TaxID=34254 RepID=A0AAV3QQ08_LITER